MTGYETDEHPMTAPEIAGTSGIPVAAPAWSVQLTMSSTVLSPVVLVPTMARSCPHAVMVPLRAAFAFSFESMKSTTSLRPARPPPPALLFRNFAAPLTPSTEPWKIPGTIGLSTSAITAMWISVAVTPTSVAVGFSVAADADVAATVPAAAIATDKPTMKVRVVLSMSSRFSRGRRGRRRGWRGR